MRYLLSVLALVAAPVFAHDYKVGDIMIMHPVSYPTIARSGAGYMDLMNMGDDDALIEVRADFPRVMMHDTVVENGISKMMHQMKVDLPSGEAISFAPGGLHVMFMGLSEKWNVGDEIPATLVFEKAGEVDVVFKVEERPKEATDHGDHSNH